MFEIEIFFLLGSGYLYLDFPKFSSRTLPQIMRYSHSTKKMQKRGISVAATALKHPKTYACVQLTVAHSGFAIGPPLWVL